MSETSAQASTAGADPLSLASAEPRSRPVVASTPGRRGHAAPAHANGTFLSRLRTQLGLEHVRGKRHQPVPPSAETPAAADAAPAPAAPAADLATRLRSAFGLQAASARTEDENRDDELRRLREVAAKWGTTPILDEEDLKYEGMLTLDDRDKPVLDWVKRNAADRLCIRVRRSGGNTLAWVITNDPGSAEVAAVCSLLDLKGWEVRVRPATRRVVERAVVRDQALTPTEVEEKFRDLISDALDADASDIHFEVRGDNGNTRFRVNGEMQDVTREDQQPRFTRPVIEQFGNYMFNRLAKRGSRQFVTNMALNASAQMKVRDQEVALRFSTAPDIRGVDIFVRVWRPDQQALALDDLGYEADHIKLLGQAIRKPYGVILFSGPTGSGKSSSLTALIDGLDDAEKEHRKIVSLEEPVERELAHVTHVSVSAITDQGGWKALLGGLNRWDSNINILGEIKDADSAKALQDLATSGKLMLTTLHASNVLSIPARMEELGVNHQLLYDANFLVLLVNQRLVPKLCEHCRIPLWGGRQGDRARSSDDIIAEKLAKERDVARQHGVPASTSQRREADYLHNVDRYRSLFPAHEAPHVSLRGPGCRECATAKFRHAAAKGTGIVGRALVAEMVAVDEASRGYIRARDWDGWRLALTKTGWSSIRDHVVQYVKRGMMDPVDVEKLVCSLDESAPHG